MRHLIDYGLEQSYDKLLHYIFNFCHFFNRLTSNIIYLCFGLEPSYEKSFTEFEEVPQCAAPVKISDELTYILSMMSYLDYDDFSQLLRRPGFLKDRKETFFMMIDSILSVWRIRPNERGDLRSR